MSDDRPPRPDGPPPTGADRRRAEPPGAPPALQLQAVHAAYGRIEVLHGVALHVPRGSVFALLGPNGAGKSTMLQVAGGRLRPTAGTVLVGGEPLRARVGADRLVRHGVCSIPEGRGVFPNLTVRENLLLWATGARRRRSEVEQRAYQRFPRLGERRRQLAGTLSGGEQQMLSLARTLAGSPQLLLIDELSMGLAPLVVAELYAMVADMARAEQLTVVLAEQFVQTAAAVADRAALVVHGRVQQVGPPAELAGAALGHYLTGVDSAGGSGGDSAGGSGGDRARHQQP